MKSVKYIPSGHWYGIKTIVYIQRALDIWQSYFFKELM